MEKENTNGLAHNEGANEFEPDTKALILEQLAKEVESTTKLIENLDEGTKPSENKVP